jgi:hypothetical protein
MFRFVEQTYKMEMTPAQNAQLSKAIGTGSDKGVFVLPKGKALVTTVTMSDVWT